MKQLIVASVLASALGTLYCSQEPKITALQNALVIAIEKNNLEAVGENLKLGASPTEPNFRGIVPLLAAAKGGDENIIMLLLQGGTSPNCTNSYGETALHKAVQYDNAAVVNLLLNYGAKKFIADRSGSLPLHIACRRQNKQIIELLIEDDLNQLCAQDDAGNTPVHYLARSTPELLKLVLLGAAQCGVMQTVNAQGCIPLLSAVRCGLNKDTLELLLEVTPWECINSQDEHGYTVLHRLVEVMNINESVAAEFEKTSSEEYMESQEYPELLELICSASIDPTIKNTDGLTAIQMANGLLTKEILNQFFTT